MRILKSLWLVVKVGRPLDLWQYYIGLYAFLGGLIIGGMGGLFIGAALGGVLLAYMEVRYTLRERAADAADAEADAVHDAETTSP